MENIRLPLSHNISCKLCLGLYNQPKILSCLHSFCLDCLKEYVKDASTEHLECPVCHDETKITSEGIDILVDNDLLVKRIRRNINFVNIFTKPGNNIDDVVSNVLNSADVESVEQTQNIPLHVKLEDTCATDGSHTDPYISHEHVKTKKTMHQLLMRRHLQGVLSSLQNEAINVVYGIDTLNEESRRHEQRKNTTKEKIQLRSRLIIDSIRRRERQLLNEIETIEKSSHIASDIETTKATLQSHMRKMLSIVDFIRLLIDSDDDVNVENYFGLIAERMDLLSNENVVLHKTDRDFNVPKANIDESIEKLFGIFTTRNEAVHIWNMPNEMIQISSTDVEDKLPLRESKSMVTIQENSSVDSESAIKSQPVEEQLEFTKSFDAEHEYPETKRRISIAECTPLTTKKLPIRLSHSFDINLKVRDQTDLLPSPPTNNQSTEDSDTDKSKHYQWRQSNRRHTVSNIQEEIQENDERWGALFPATTSDKSRTRVRHMSEDLHRTRQMINICKRQIADSKTRAVPEMEIYGTVSGSDILARDRFLQLRESVKNKVAKWRRNSTEST